MNNFRSFLRGLVPAVNGPVYYFFEMPQKKDNYRIFTNYNTAKTGDFKIALGELLKMKFDSNWHWHHVVEKTHLKLLANPAEVEALYAESIPCVLVHNPTEHINFNALLHTSGTRAVFDLPTHSNQLTGSDREIYLNSLHQLYNIVYEKDRILRTVANNVLLSL